MKEQKQWALESIRQQAGTFGALSDTIWEYAELSLKEFRSAQEYARVLAELGFTVQTGLCGMPTAFSGSYGSGRPIIGILGEFDALSGLSQKAAVARKEELVHGGAGHGCGHNLLGAGALAAAYGIKCYLEKTGGSGTVIFYGTPGEEGGAGKAFMAKEGIFRDLDCALTWHPADSNEVVTGTCNSCIQTLYKFRGTAAHAAGDPEDGRSALDAMELMNVGVQYLREHVKSDARIHYAIVDGGGLSPNVVQPTASVLYMVRSCLVKDALALQERVDKIARGAAMMTETQVEKIFIDGCSNTVPNHTLEQVLQKNFEELGLPDYTAEEEELAAALRLTYNPAGGEGLKHTLTPLCTEPRFSPGSTDVGDVSWETPTAQIHAVCFPAGAPGHSWQNVSAGRSSFAYKGMLKAAEVLCAAAIDLYEDPALRQAAREEFEKAAADGYTCPIPPEEQPKAIEI